MKILRIGVLINEFRGLSNWQLRIIQDILDHPELEVVIIGNDGIDGTTQGKETSSGFKRKFSLSFNFVTGLLHRQLALEQRTFFPKPETVLLQDIRSQLTNSTHINIKFSAQELGHTFTRNDIKRIEKENLGIILNFSSLDDLSEISELPKYGVWLFKFADMTLDKKGPIGFWEVLDKHEGIGFSLLRATSVTKEMLIIDTAFFNRGWSITETRNTVQEAAVSVFSKTVHSLLNGTFKSREDTFVVPSSNRTYALKHLLQYCFVFYTMVAQKAWEKATNRLLGWRPERWSLFLGDGAFMDADLSSSEPLDMPGDEFWADPFLFEHEKVKYVFFENYSYRTKRGKISCGRMEGKALIDVVDVLDLDYHLSFPYIFKEDGEIYLMPETSENDRLEIYRAVNFPTTWELYSTAFEGEKVADAFFHTDNNKERWLFLNKQIASTSPMNSELYIYKVDSIKLESMEPHAQNPVIIDARVARNGGAILSFAGQRYRPSQRNTDAIYGRALNLNRIEKLTLNEYVEITERVVRPDFDKKLMAMHHVHQLGDTYVFDAAYRRK
ncbi:hypothetical protein ACFQZJ_06700 [Maribacter chungangensis]|uniref:Glucosamine inositolphosphorylceramide transferase 1 N-terminal domain-containing protein n=1 Tax=Maribacter chungangensis TaxID=1069117 RepID=A0ABW3B214_9FLAO